MSLICLLVKTTDAVIDDLLEKPELLELYLLDEEDYAVDLGKAWDGINFVLSGGKVRENEDTQDPLC